MPKLHGISAPDATPTGCKLLRTRGAARRYDISESWLNNARVRGDGPPFVKIGALVLYDVDVADAWFAARTQRSTSESTR